MGKKEERRRRAREQALGLVKDFTNKSNFNQSKKSYSGKPKKPIHVLEYVKLDNAYVKSDNVILDTNTIKNSWDKVKLKEIQQLLKKTKPKIILTDTTLNESVRIINTDKNTLIKDLKNKFGNEKFRFIDNTPDIVENAGKMLKKYDSLHKPDDNILAVAKKLNAAIITHDGDLKDCCEQEEIEVYDHHDQTLEPSDYELLQKQRKQEQERRFFQ